MDLPPGFDDQRNDGMVCRLKKSLYGLKQSPRAWFDRFTRAIRKHGYKQAQSDHTLFYKQNDGKITILIVYVDDMILTEDYLVEMRRVKEQLALEFEIKDLRNLRYFLGMEVARNRSGIYVSQRKYVINFLKEIGMLGYKLVNTPVDPSVKLDLHSVGALVEKRQYQRLVSKLIYLSHTRSDITIAVSCISQYMHTPLEIHMEAAYRVLKYLKGTSGRGLFFKKTKNQLIEVYTDVDWVGSVSDRRSTSRYCTFI